MKTSIRQGVMTLSLNQWFDRRRTRALICAAIGIGVFFAPVARGQTNGCAAAPAGLVSWWRGEGNTLDSVRTNHGSAVGGVTIVPGKVGNGLGFDGTGYVVVPHHPSLNCSNALTIELWYNSAQSNDVYYGIIDKRVGAVGANYGINVAAGAGLGVYYDDLAVQDGDDTASSFEASRYAPAPEPGVFHHLAATYRQISNNLVRLETYLDGQNVRTRYLAGNLANTINTSPVTIGATAQGAGEFFQGVIDEVSIYNRVLSATELQSIYAAGAAGKCTGGVTNPPPTAAGVPVIISFSPLAAPVGTPITLTGTNFSPVWASNIVYFGATRAVVSAASPTNLVAILPSGATYASISVTVNGQTALSPLSFLPTFAGTGTNVTTASFAPGQNLTVADGPIKSAIADVDGDGKPDLVVANSYAHNVSLLHNISVAGTLDGSSFASRVDLPVVGGTDSPRCIAVADVDGDGKLDILIGDQATSSVLVYRNISTPGLLNASSFAAPVSFSAGANSYPHGLRVADLNGDGRPEILVANQSGDSISILKNIGSAGSLTTNSFAPQTALVTGANPTDIGIGDFNGDGRPDLVTTAFNGSQLSVLRNIATTGAAASNWFVLEAALPALAGSLEITVTDLDGDAKSDLVVASVHGYAVSVFRNQATAGVFNTNSFAARVDYSAPGWVHSISVADFNGDAKPDIAAVGELNSYLAVFQNQSTPGSIVLGTRVDFGTGWNAWGVVAGDLDGDNRADIVFANSYDDTLTFYRNIMGQGTNTNSPPTGCYNASDAFTTNSNPNGVWSYGYSPTLGDPVIPFFEQGNWGGLDFWRSNIWYNVPGIYFNPTSETIINPTSTIMLQPGQLALHPGPNGELAVLRFTAPNDDAYQIAVEFSGADILGATTDVHLLLNGSPQRSGLVDGFGPGSGPSINTNLFLRAGDHLDFAVGRGANNEFTYDATAIAVQICTTSNRPPNSCAPPPSGLAGWWRAEGGWEDAVGGNDAAPQFAAGFANGTVGQAFNFDGVDQVAHVANAPALNPTNAMTLESWIYINAYSANDGVALFGKDGVHSERQYMVGIADMSRTGATNVPNTWIARAHLSVPTEFKYFDGTTVLEKEKWHHVAMTYDGAALRLYVNGVLDRSEPLAGPIITTAQPLVIGGSVSGPWDFNGRVDELSLYHRALSASEISAIFAAGSAGKCALPAVAPRITQQPQSVSTNANSNVRFSVVASGLPQPGYQWYFAGNALFGQTNATLTLTSVQTNHAGSYYVVAANPLGAVTSSVVTLTVLTYPPIITVQPQDRITYAGKTVSFAVQATGTAPLRYQWSKNGTNILNATSQTLTLPNVQTNATGLYRVLVSNNYGSTNSRAAQLTVLPPPGCLPAPDGAIAWWPGESNTVDVIGGFDATLLQSPPAYLLYTTGKVGAALNLGQFATYGSVTTGGGLNVNAGSGLTIEGWIRPNTYAVGPVAEWNDGRRNVGAGLLINSTGPGVIEATMTDTNIPGRFMALRSATYAVTNGVWQHVAMTYDKGSGLAALYVNGVPVAQTNIGSMTPSTSTDVYLGYRPSGSYSGARFNGALDEITLYNRALTPTELQAIIMADEAGKCPPPPIACQIPVADIAGWWRGESNVLDSINLNHGFVTPTNTPTQYSYGVGRYGAAFSTMMSSYPIVPARPSLDVGTGDGLTVEAWVSYNSGFPVVEWNSGTGTQGVYIAYSSTRGPGYLEANLVDNQGQSHLLISPFINPVYQQWRHVAVTYDRTSGQAALFVNGAVVTQTNLGSFTPRTTGNLYFGYRPTGPYSGSGARLNGWLDEIAIYRRALSASELRCVYRAGAAKYPAALACVPPAEGIVGWWRGESNLVDSVQSNHGVSAPGGMPIYTTGRVGRAITVGAGRYVTIRSSQSLDVGKGLGFTVETWINPTNTTPSTLFGWGDNYPEVGLDYYSFSGGGGASPYLQARLVDINGVTRLVTTSGYLVKTGIWQHVALSYDRTSGWATIYLNGTPITATNLGSFTPRTSGGFNLGWRPGGNYVSFSGAIDETAIYNRALSAPEINAIYQATTGRCIQPPVIVQVPANQRVNAGSNVTLTVVAEGNPLLRYQWGQNLSPAGGNIMLAGRTNASLTLTNVQAKDSGRYWIRVTNNFGMATASNILLTVNYGPVAKNLSLTTAEDTAQAFKLPVTDANQDPLLYTILTQPTNGTLSGTAPDLVYTPKPEFSGGDSFAFLAFDGLLNSAAATVAITVTPVNDTPIALSQIVATDEDLSLPITLGATDAEGEALAFALTPPTHGILSGVAPNLIYTPHTNYHGDDLFTFTAQDASGGVSQVAAISITVRSVNDAPVAKIEIAPLDELPGLTNTIAIAPVCCAATLRLDASLSSDAENDPLTYAWLAGTNVLSSEAITTNRFEPGAHEITLVISDGHEAVTKTVTVEILTSSEAVGYLKLLVEAGVTETRTRMPMLNWLRQAGDAFDRCHIEQGVHFLKMFKALVAERLSASDPDLATSLIETTEAILDAAADCDPCRRLGRHDRKHGDGDRDGHDKPREERENSGRNQRDSEPKSNRGGQSRGDAERSAAAEIRAERSSPRAR